MDCFRIARAAPERVRKLVLVNSGLLTTRGEFEDMLHRLGVGSPWELLLPTTAEGVQRLIGLSNFRPPRVPSWILRDTIPVRASVFINLLACVLASCFFVPRKVPNPPCLPS